MTTTGAGFTPSSAALNACPSMGGTPVVAKKLAVTRAACSGRISPRSSQPITDGWTQVTADERVRLRIAQAEVVRPGLEEDDGPAPGEVAERLDVEEPGVVGDAQSGEDGGADDRGGGGRRRDRHRQDEDGEDATGGGHLSPQCWRMITDEASEMFSRE